MKTKTPRQLLCVILLVAGCNLAPGTTPKSPPIDLVFTSVKNARVIPATPDTTRRENSLKDRAETPRLSEAEKKWGVQVMSLRTTSAGYMLDFRFKVIEPEKAKPLLDKKVQAYIFHPQTGARLGVPTAPKTGALRQKTTDPEAGKIYFIFFTNPGQLLRAGDEVNVVIGDFTADHLVVQ